MQKLRIELGEETNDELYDLLLLADPSKDIVDEYLERENVTQLGPVMSLQGLCIAKNKAANS